MFNLHQFYYMLTCDSDPKLKRWPTPPLSYGLKMSFGCSSTILLSSPVRSAVKSCLIGAFKVDTVTYVKGDMNEVHYVFETLSPVLHFNKYAMCSSSAGSSVLIAITLGKYNCSLSGIYSAVVFFWITRRACSTFPGSLSLKTTFLL